MKTETHSDANPHDMQFWYWVFSREGGLRRIHVTEVVCYLLVGALTGYFASTVIKGAGSALLPLVGVMVGLTLTWVSTGVAVMGTPEFLTILEKSEGGAEAHINYFHMALFVGLVATIGWAVVAAGPYPAPRPIAHLVGGINHAALGFLGFVTAMAIREAWSAMNLVRVVHIAYLRVKAEMMEPIPFSPSQFETAPDSRPQSRV